MYVHLKYVYDIGTLRYLAFYFFSFMHKLSQNLFQESLRFILEYIVKWIYPAFGLSITNNELQRDFQ
jgi:hypothetical protein